MSAVEKKVQALAEVCDVCRTQNSLIGWAHSDLNAAARKLARRQSTRNLRAVADAKEKLASQRSAAEQHLNLTHETTVPA